MQVSYFSYPGAPGSYFRCERYGTMNTDACARNFAAAPVASREGRLGGCLGCHIGVQHSGGSLTRAAAPPPGWCIRCRRSPEEYSGSGVSRVRLVNGGICVSCANREYEVRKGANAKGVPPKKWSTLGPSFTGLVMGDRVVVARGAFVLDRLEVGLAAMRRGSGALAMCWVSMGVLPPLHRGAPIEQMTLFDGGGRSRPPLRSAPKSPIATRAAQQYLFLEA